MFNFSFDRRAIYILIAIIILSSIVNYMNNPESFFWLIVSIPGVLIAITFHEFAHGYVASKLGDKTSKYSGRLTLNPIYHVDPVGLLVMFLFGFGWAKPVPIDPRNFKNPKVGMALTAAAGPISNILAALFGGFLYYGTVVVFYQSISATAFELIKYFFLSYI